MENTKYCQTNYFLVSDNYNAMGILAFGELKTEAQKDDNGSAPEPDFFPNVPFTIEKLPLY